MTDERAIIAIERIDQALSRLEAAGVAPSAGGDDGAGAEELARLRETHRGLRSRIEGAIAQIDLLLAEEES